MVKTKIGEFVPVLTPIHSLLTAEGLPLRGGTSEEVNEESRQASDVRSGWTEAGPVTTKKPT